jgi:hypothetical protein
VELVVLNKMLSQNVAPAVTSFPASWSVLLFSLLCLLSGPLAAIDDDELKRINSVKAAFVLNIARFVAWPASQATSHTLCLYRSNPIGEAMETIRGKRISNLYLNIEIISSLDHSNNSCTILFIPFKELMNFKAEVTDGIKRPLLTIADLTAENAKTGIPYKGVMVSLVRDETRIKLEVNLQQTHSAGLKMNSQLLKIAHILNDGGH